MNWHGPFHILLLLVALTAPPSEPAPHIVIAPNGKEVVQPIPTSVKLVGTEFELLILKDYSGPVTWRAKPSGAFGLPIELIELKPRETIVGLRAGTGVPKRHAAPDMPSVGVFRINTGTATVEAWGVIEVDEDGKKVTRARFLAEFIVYSGVDPPTPIPTPPGPNPPGPNPPGPNPPGPDPDAALVLAFKAALSKDIAASNGTKAKAADLAVVFESGAALLDLGDPAIAPRTVGDLYSKMVLASVAKGIPRLPYLKETRGVVEANTPLLNGTTEMTETVKAQFQAAYRKVAAALTEASK